MSDAAPAPVDPRTTAFAALIAVGTALATLLADWVTVRVQMPLGVLLVLFIFILLPTGDLIRLLAELIDAARPKKQRDSEFRPGVSAKEYGPNEPGNEGRNGR